MGCWLLVGSSSGMCGGGRDQNKRLLVDCSPGGSSSSTTITSEMAPSITVPPDSTKVTPEQSQQQNDSATPDPPQVVEAARARSQDMIPQVEQLQPAGYKVVPALDLSDDKDLQKAIALSIQEQQQHHYSKPGGDSGADVAIDDAAMIVSAEDREVSRALEESLKEIPNVDIKKKYNPNERKRDPLLPIGLVNIGNSCWFNVVSQPLFHLPGFREMILNYKHTGPLISSTPSSKEKAQPPKVAMALSKLFALMLASEQKYVAPTECVHLFQGGEMETRRNEQEDVCEFIHKLLERLEIEFNEIMREEGEEKESSGLTKDVQFKNPIMKFFYGQFRKENILSNSDEEHGIKQETFGQYPLHVLKYGDIHDSILASMSGRLSDRKQDQAGAFDPNLASRAEESRSDSEVQQESWFKLLPPVLIFSLSRYEFSQATQRAEKVHNKFEFPELLYMDRYMEANKQLVRRKHIQVAAIKKQLAQLNHTLKQYQQFGACEDKYPLKDILVCSLQFAETGVIVEAEAEVQSAENQSFEQKNEVKGETEMSEAPVEEGVVAQQEGNESVPTVDVCLTSPADMQTDTDDNKPEAVEGMEVDSGDENKPVDMTDSLHVTYGDPKAGPIRAEELDLLRRCLSRWERQVRDTETELCGHISQLEKRLKEMYNERELLQTAYQLHAVVVHEGQASAGHYWVYIRHQDGWRKYNDVQVTRSSWDELQQDSLGGQNNASAYCLMYTDTARQSLLYPPANDVNENLHDLLQTLPIHLQEYVKQDNISFKDEVEKWENRSSQAASVSSPAPGISASQQSSPHSSRTPGCDAGLPPPTAPNSPSAASSAPDHDDQFDTAFFVSVSTIMARVMHDSLNREIEFRAVNDNLAKSGSPPDSLQSEGPQELPSQHEALVKILQSGIDEIVSASKQWNSTAAAPTPTLLDFGLFLLQSGTPQANKLLYLHACLVLKQLALASTASSPVVEVIIAKCSKFISEFRFMSNVLSRAYKFWQMKYKLMLDAVWHLICGWEAFSSDNHMQALPLFLKAYHLHNDLIMCRNGDEPEFGGGTANLRVVDDSIFVECRCKCLLALNTSLIKRFLGSMNRAAAEEVVQGVTGLLVPALGELANFGKEGDAWATVRHQWCELLEKNLPVDCTPLIQQVLEAVLNADAAPAHGEEQQGAGAAVLRYRPLPVSLRPLPAVMRLYHEYRQMLVKMGVTPTPLC